MTEASKYQVVINGTIYSLALGDDARVGSPGAGNRTAFPIITPPSPPHGVLHQQITWCR